MTNWKPLDLPFLPPLDANLVQHLAAWTPATDDEPVAFAGPALAGHCRRINRTLGDAGLLSYAVATAESPPDTRLSVRMISLIREALAYQDPLADFVFAMQGIGTLPIHRYGTPEQRRRYLPAAQAGRATAAFALSEPDGGSDVAATATRASREGDGYRIDGTKTWISNGAHADHFIVIARTEDVATSPGARGLSAFVVNRDTPGLDVAREIDITAPHPVAQLRFTNCRVRADQMLGKPGEGFQVAMSTLDTFRASVGAAGVGMARRALDETRLHVQDRRLFGKRMADMDSVRMRVADMALDIESAAMLVYRAGWLRDERGVDITREASSAKLAGSEAAFRVVDNAVQLFGAKGVSRGHIIERLFRDVRPMRIYEGASEIQKIIIGRRVLTDGI